MKSGAFSYTWSRPFPALALAHLLHSFARPENMCKTRSIFHYLQSMYCAKGNLWFFRIYHSTPILLRNIIIAHLCYTVNPPISHSTLLISHSTLLISDSAFLISHSTLLILHSPPILYRHISQVTWSIRVLYGYRHLCPEKNPVKKRDIPIFFL